MTDESTHGSTLGLDTALAQYCNAGHGVVLGGQTHWLTGREGWNAKSAVGGPDHAVRGQVGDVHVRRRLPEPGLAREPPDGARLGEAALPHPRPDALHRDRPELGRADHPGLLVRPDARDAAARVVGCEPVPHVPAGVPGRAPDRCRPRRRPRLPPVVGGRGGRRLRPGQEPGRRAHGPVAVVGDEPHPADRHALHPAARQPVRPGDGRLRPRRQGRRSRRLPRPALPLQGRSRQLALGGRQLVRALPPRPAAASTPSTARPSTRAGTSPRTPRATPSASAPARSADRAARANTTDFQPVRYSDGRVDGPFLHPRCGVRGLLRRLRGRRRAGVRVGPGASARPSSPSPARAVSTHERSALPSARSRRRAPCRRSSRSSRETPSCCNGWRCNASGRPGLSEAQIRSLFAPDPARVRRVRAYLAEPGARGHRPHRHDPHRAGTAASAEHAFGVGMQRLPQRRRPDVRRAGGRDPPAGGDRGRRADRGRPGHVGAPAARVQPSQGAPAAGVDHPDLHAARRAPSRRSAATCPPTSARAGPTARTA